MLVGLWSRAVAVLDSLVQRVPVVHGVVPVPVPVPMRVSVHAWPGQRPHLGLSP